MRGSSAAVLYQQIGKAIQALRKQHKPKMSQQVLAEAIGVSRASIANIERGYHHVQIHVLYDLSVALEVEPHDLLPHPNNNTVESNLPADVTKELNPKERVAVGRLLQDRHQGESK